MEIQKIIMPIIKVSGKPIVKIFSCGAALVITPKAIFISTYELSASKANNMAALITQVKRPAIIA